MRYKKWKKDTPQNWLEYFGTPVSLSTRIVNFIFQKIFRQNSKQKYMVHFTSTVSGNVQLGKGVVRYIAGGPNCYIQGLMVFL